jgi:methionyl-tRNA formyltransferase
MLRVVFVTSKVTYVPRNYEDLFTEFFKNISNIEVAGLILLDNLDLSLIKSVAGLKYLGANKVQRTLIKNIIYLPLKKREKLFQKRNIEVKEFKSMNDAEAIEWCNKKDIDVIINVRTRCIYKTDILQTPKLGCINIHHGILPTYRGTMCDLYALSENRPAGFTIHQMNKKIDDGVIFKATEVSQGEHNDYIDYLQVGAAIEGKDLAELMNETSKLGNFPAGQINKCDSKIYTKNPTREQVKYFKKNGMKL